MILRNLVSFSSPEELGYLEKVKYSPRLIFITSDKIFYIVLDKIFLLSN